ITRNRRPSRITNVYAKRQQEEHTAEHIFALRNPRDRFHMQRMNRKERGNKSTWPDTASPARTTRHLAKHEKEQDDSNHVQHNIGEMMSAGIEPKELAIEHVGDRRQRMPVSRVAMRERRNNSGQREAAGYDRVFIDVNVIVEINEFMVQRLVENKPSDCD